MAGAKRPTQAQMRKAVDDWNAKHGKHTAVRYWAGVREGDGVAGETYSGAMVLGGHTAGVYVRGAGFVALTHVEAVPGRAA